MQKRVEIYRHKYDESIGILTYWDECVSVKKEVKEYTTR